MLVGIVHIRMQLKSLNVISAVTARQHNAAQNAPMLSRLLWMIFMRVAHSPFYPTKGRTLICCGWLMLSHNSQAAAEACTGSSIRLRWRWPK